MTTIKLLTESTFMDYINDIVELYRIQFTSPVQIADFEWRYLKTPLKDFNAIIALDDEKVIGFIGTMPNQLKYHSKTIKSAMFTNIMTHPAYYGKGIFSNLSKHLEQSLINKGYEFIYSFPNYQSNHILINNCGWMNIYEIPRLELKKETYYPLSKVSCLKVVEDDNYLLNYSDIRCSLGKKGFIRNVDFLKWRIHENPVYLYKNFACVEDNIVKGYLVLREYKDECNIVDISFESLVQAELLINQALEFFIKKDFKILTSWCPINTKLHSLFEKRNFLNKEPITYFAGKYIGSKLDSNDKYNLLIWNDWFVHAIDDNIY